MFLLLCRQYLQVDSRTRGSKINHCSISKTYPWRVSLLVSNGSRCEPLMLVGKGRLVVVAYTSTRSDTFGYINRYKKHVPSRSQGFKLPQLRVTHLG